MGIADVKHVILVLSGKGGVGKTSVAVHLAFAIREMGFKVGILDTDLCGPNVPYMLNLQEGEVRQCLEGWIPVFTDQSQTLAVMSLGFLMEDKDEAVVWRGPKKNALIKQFLQDIRWDERDYLIIDMPPGTTDEHITLVENVKNMKNNLDVGAVLVTTPQAVAVNDVRREVTFCQTAGLRIIGIVENMSEFVCPNCQECYPLFSKGGGIALATEAKVPFLGAVPLDPEIGEPIGKCLSYDKSESIAFQTLHQIARTVTEWK